MGPGRLGVEPGGGTIVRDDLLCDRSLGVVPRFTGPMTRAALADLFAEPGSTIGTLENKRRRDHLLLRGRGAVRRIRSVRPDSAACGWIEHTSALNPPKRLLLRMIARLNQASGLALPVKA